MANVCIRKSHSSLPLKPLPSLPDPCQYSVRQWEWAPSIPSTPGFAHKRDTPSVDSNSHGFTCLVRTCYKELDRTLMWSVMFNNNVPFSQTTHSCTFALCVWVCRFKVIRSHNVFCSYLGIEWSGSGWKATGYLQNMYQLTLQTNFGELE